MGEHGWLKDRGVSDQCVIAAVATPIWRPVACSVERKMMALLKGINLLSASRWVELTDMYTARCQAMESSVGVGWKVSQHAEQLPSASLSSAPSTVQDLIVREMARELLTRELQQRTGKEVGQGLGRGKEGKPISPCRPPPQRSLKFAPRAGVEVTHSSAVQVPVANLEKAARVSRRLNFDGTPAKGPWWLKFRAKAAARKASKLAPTLAEEAKGKQK
jgi:hypothetical protein